MSVSDLVDFEGLTAEEVVAQVVAEAHGGPVCLTSSFQTEDMVVLHMLKAALPEVPVIFLETGYHFPELTAYRDRMAEEWKLNLVNALPVLSLDQHEGQYGKLHIVQPTECCRMRKVEPLMRSLEPFDWWFTGLRREQSPTRAGLKKIEEHTTPTGKKMKKVSILADWTMARVDAYAVEHGIPRLELYDRGYTSIGCEPCTAIPAVGADPRSEKTA
jgi:phosphoadenosine phosphosulfate reductase